MRRVLFLLLLVVGCGDDIAQQPADDMTAIADASTDAATTWPFPPDMFPASCLPCLMAKCAGFCATDPPDLHVSCNRCVGSVTHSPDAGVCSFPIYGCGACSAVCPEF